MTTPCIYCGDTGIKYDGSLCECRHTVSSLYDSVSCLEIPEQYRNILFNKGLVPLDMELAYADFLDEVHTRITTGKWNNQNLCIASPIAHSKTIMAYSCINALFRAGISVFPLFDVLEISRILNDMDMGKTSVYDVDQPERILTVPILFAKIPRVSRWEVFDCISMLVDRRVRRGNSTILLYDGTWQQLVNSDRNEILIGMKGNGNFGTISVRSWGLALTKKGIEFEDNIG